MRYRAFSSPITSPFRQKNVLASVFWGARGTPYGIWAGLNHSTHHHATSDIYSIHSIQYISIYSIDVLLYIIVSTIVDIVEELCDGNVPLVNPSTGRSYNCDGGREACPGGSYCHRLATVAGCCKEGIDNTDSTYCVKTKSRYL